MDKLREVQRYMSFIGWKGVAETGFSHKEDANGQTVATAHDATWHDDCAEAEAFAVRMERRHERERESIFKMGEGAK